MKTLQGSGMNLNPQQDGLRIYVPIPKVTKEYREKLVKGRAGKIINSLIPLGRDGAGRISTMTPFIHLLG